MDPALMSQKVSKWFVSRLYSQYTVLYSMYKRVITYNLFTNLLLNSWDIQVGSEVCHYQEQILEDPSLATLQRLLS